MTENDKQKISDPGKAGAWLTLTRRYLEDLPQQCEALCQALDQEDRVTVKALAHRAKGTSGTYRLKTIAAQFAQIETQAVTATVDDLHQQILSLRQRIQQTITSLPVSMQGDMHE